VKAKKMPDYKQFFLRELEETYIMPLSDIDTCSVRVWRNGWKGLGLVEIPGQ
jgi:hypothetical protein